MKGIKKRVPLDVTALSSDDWRTLADLLQKAGKRNGGPEITLDGREKLVVPVAIEHVKFARRLKSARNQRSRFFDDSLFGEPAWDILLTLFIADSEGYRMAIGEVTEACHVPSTTALRWFGRLQDEDLIQRYPNRTDNRIVYLTLTPAGFARMSALLEELTSIP